MPEHMYTNLDQMAVVNTPKNFIAGKIKNYFDNWCKLTHDSWILDVVKGYKIGFIREPYQVCSPKPLTFSESEYKAAQIELEKFLCKQIVERVCIMDECERKNSFYSNIFLRPKKDGSFRIILNLKNLNQYVDNCHFKMETLKSALLLVKSNCWFSALDIKDAYYSVKIHPDSRKFLRFRWENRTYQFTCLPMGLASAPRVFTKIMKPVFSELRKFGHLNVIYIDDVLLLGNTKNECEDNLKATIKSLDSLGFTIHPDKSQFHASQSIVFLGFILDSSSMTVRLTADKAQSVKEFCEVILNKNEVTIKQVAQLVGMFVASEPGVEFARLYYKNLEIEKDVALKLNKGNFDAHIKISNQSRILINWWSLNVCKSFKSLVRNPPNFVFKSDSSKFGWGGVNEDSGEAISGLWDENTSESHINYLELLAGFKTIKGLGENLRDSHVRLCMDNSVAVSYVNKQGGKISTLNDLAHELWLWCIDRDIWLSAEHVQGATNIIADSLSRKNVDMEWKLDEVVFQKLINVCGKCDVDLFASKDNHQLEKYFTYTQDSNAIGVDAFAQSWKNIDCYLFPPFSVISSVLKKIEEEEVQFALLIAPVWKTQAWFPQLLHQVAGPCYLLPKTEHLLKLPKDPKRQHPLTKMKMGAFSLSGNAYMVESYQQTLSTLSADHGGNPQKDSIGVINRNGCNFVVKNRVIHLMQI